MKHALWIALFLMPLAAAAQHLLENSGREIRLSDGLRVTVYAARDCGQCYYYLPPQLRLSVREDKQPEISFLTWTGEEGGEVEGGILHFLLVWGLTAAQEKEVRNRLVAALDSTAVLMGAALVEAAGEAEGVAVHGKSATADAMRGALTSRSGVATTPGAKMALSFRFDGPGANQILETVRRPANDSTDFRIELAYALVTDDIAVPRRRTITLVLPFKELTPFIRKGG